LLLLNDRGGQRGFSFHLAGRFSKEVRIELTRLSPVLVDRLLVFEQQAAHLTAVADASAHVARERADAAQRALSEVKVFVALLGDDTKLELKAPKPGVADPAARLGVRVRLPVRPPQPKRERQAPIEGPAPPQGSPLARYFC
jgi:hypothetical protein